MLLGMMRRLAESSDLPVVVIGAGPQGLAAAAHLLERGLEPLVLESGLGPASAVAEWGHVRLFSAWPELVDQASARLLARSGWTPPDAGYPTGADWIDGYLAPLAKVLGQRVRYDARVTGVSRKGRDRLVDAGRAAQPFTVHLIDCERHRVARRSTRGARRLRHVDASRTRQALMAYPATGRKGGGRNRTRVLPCLPSRWPGGPRGAWASTWWWSAAVDSALTAIHRAWRRWPRSRPRPRWRPG